EPIEDVPELEPSDVCRPAPFEPCRRQHLRPEGLQLQERSRVLCKTSHRVESRMCGPLQMLGSVVKRARPRRREAPEPHVSVRQLLRVAPAPYRGTDCGHDPCRRWCSGPREGWRPEGHVASASIRCVSLLAAVLGPDVETGLG